MNAGRGRSPQRAVAVEELAPQRLPACVVYGSPAARSLHLAVAIAYGAQAETRIGEPQGAVGRLDELGVGLAGPDASRHEHVQFGPHVHYLTPDDDPHSFVARDMHRFHVVRRKVVGLARVVPVDAVEALEPAGRARPDDAGIVLRELRDAAVAQTVLRPVVCDRAALDEGRTAEAITDPQAAGSRRMQRHDIAGRQSLAAKAVDALEANAVEAKQSCRRSDPQIAIARLRQELDARGRAFGCGPGCVIELPDVQVRRQREGARREQERGRQQWQQSQELECLPPSPHTRPSIRRGEARGGCPRAFQRHYARSDLRPMRTSSVKSFGCSQAAKWPPFSSLL